MTDIRPFKIDVPEAKIELLKKKLALSTEFPSAIDDEETWNRGVPPSEVKRILDYWTSKWDWRRTEAKLNKLPQFTTSITVEGFPNQTMHFVHAESNVKTAIPLLFIHGWPGQFSEVEKILPLLISGNSKDIPAFHVVAPSLINFGFSSRCVKKGWNVDAHAHSCHQLMQKLGYEKYVVQGGDLGSFTARAMVQHYPDHIGGHLLNLAGPRKPDAERDPELYKRWSEHTLTDREKSDMEWVEATLREGMGYYQIQMTKPQTLGYSMADSPLGLMAWVYEKMHDWSHNYPWTCEEILQWVAIYYFSTPGPNATQSIYYDSVHFRGKYTEKDYSPVPLGMSRFPKELDLSPRMWHETLGPLVFWSEHDQGGHFAAWEAPEELVDDLRNMFGEQGPCARCCGWRTGYKDK